MKKNRLWLYFLPFGVIFLALAVFSFFVKWWAPLLILAALGLQIIIVYTIIKDKMNSGYRDRAFERRNQYDKDGDAEAWLAAEQQEAASVGFKYCSSGVRALNALNLADALNALNRTDEAAVHLAAIEPKNLSRGENERFDALCKAVGRLGEA